MKRRGFLGLMGGAAVAGPAMAKQAVSATMADMSLQGIAASGMGMLGGEVPMPQAANDPFNDFPARMARLALRTKSEHQERQRQMYCNALDPDLVTYRSFALHTKIAMQKRRDYWRSLENEKSWLQRRIEGVLDW